MTRVRLLADQVLGSARLARMESLGAAAPVTMDAQASTSLQARLRAVLERDRACSAALGSDPEPEPPTQPRIEQIALARATRAHTKSVHEPEPETPFAAMLARWIAEELAEPTAVPEPRGVARAAASKSQPQLGR